ncbi:MAG: 2,3-cyclic-nucleotide 2-phosphodiesterase [Bacteroidetes bacterium]|nr:2,3-cyclic-nucleotide 2-phosphodiesterase [Bacteroidota bacterium]
MDIEELNKKYRELTPEERIRMLYTDFNSVLFTSSFGTTSAFLLHLFNKVNPQQTVYFLDTTYHFNETLAYKNQLAELLKLNVIDIKPEEWKNNFTQQDKTWNSDPDLCCSINKVEPLDKIKPGFQIWVSGLMSSQNAYRESLKIFEEKDGIIKFFPIVDLSEKDAFDYIKKNNLPEHPLLKAGYNSVGCFHCTVAGKGRSGRWINKSKTECGLHL